MISDIIDQKIRNGFSQAASQYDVLTDLHREIGEKLAQKISCDGPYSRILDIGMGTGGFTGLLTAAFPDSMVVGIDFASGMINCAQEKEKAFKIVQADASFLPFKEGVFDVVVSNLAYQWIAHLSDAFMLCYSSLNKNGKLCLAMFGHKTFDELFMSLDTCLDKRGNNGCFTIRRLADKNQVTESLKEAGFCNPRVQSEYIRVQFPDMMGLVKWIKDIGANALPTDIYIGKDLLFRANDYYNAHFKDRLGIYATFEVLWVEAQR